MVKKPATLKKMSRLYLLVLDFGKPFFIYTFYYYYIHEYFIEVSNINIGK